MAIRKRQASGLGTDLSGVAAVGLVEGWIPARGYLTEVSTSFRKIQVCYGRGPKMLVAFRLPRNNMVKGACKGESARQKSKEGGIYPCGRERRSPRLGCRKAPGGRARTGTPRANQLSGLGQYGAGISTWDAKKTTHNKKPLVIIVIIQGKHVDCFRMKFSYINSKVTWQFCCNKKKKYRSGGTASDPHRKFFVNLKFEGRQKWCVWPSGSEGHFRPLNKVCHPLSKWGRQNRQYRMTKGRSVISYRLMANKNFFQNADVFSGTRLYIVQINRLEKPVFMFFVYVIEQRSDLPGTFRGGAE